MNKILFIGPIPPPFGGVSIHIKRLSTLLKNDFKIAFIDESKQIKKEYFNFRKFNLLKYFSLINKNKIIAIHSGNSHLRFFHILSCLILRKKIILTIHAYPDKKNILTRNIENIIFNQCNKIILVSHEMLSNIHINRKKLIVKHAFIPPCIEEESDLPIHLKSKLDQLKSSGKKIICGNASRLDQYNNEDLYGVDLCMSIANKLKEKKIEAIILFNVAEIDKYQIAYDTYQNQIQRENLQNYFYLFNDQISFIRLMQQSDIIIRPTNTDGDSLTVREALLLNKPIIASDIVHRPDGTIIFKNRDIKDFEAVILKTLDSLNSLNSLKDQNIHQESIQYANFYKELFNDLLK